MHSTQEQIQKLTFLTLKAQKTDPQTQCYSHLSHIDVNSIQFDTFTRFPLIQPGI